MSEDVKPLARIYFEENDSGPEKDSYYLGTSQAQEDIKRLGDAARPGLRVLLYMGDELEVEATLDIERQFNIWLARADWLTVRHFK